MTVPDPPQQSDAERFFRALTENSLSVICIVDEAAVVRYVSSSVERVLGWTPEDMVGRSGIELVHEDDLDHANDVLRAIREKGPQPWPVEIRVMHKDGSPRMIEFAARNLLDDPAVRGIVVDYHDITERKMRGAALELSEERYQKAFASSPDGIVISDLETGVYLDVNEGFERMTGNTREELIGRSSFEFGHWGSAADRERLAQGLRKKGRVRDFEAEFYDKGGRPHTGQVSAELIELDGRACLLACIRDVTTARRDEAALRRMTEELQREHKELTEKNVALKQVLEHIEQDKSSYRHQVAANIENLLRPFLTRLRDSGGCLDSAAISALERRVDTIVRDEVDPFRANLAKLTSRELDICELIRQGRTSKEIADTLGLSPETIHKHRQAIRRKLQIDHRGINLFSYLRSQ